MAASIAKRETRPAFAEAGSCTEFCRLEGMSTD